MTRIRRRTVPRGAKLARTREDLAHLLAHFAVLHRDGAVLVATRQGWALRVDTVAGTIAYSVRERDLPLFDRVARIVPTVMDDPRGSIPADAFPHRNDRLRALTEAAWLGAGVSTTRPDPTGGQE